MRFLGLLPAPSKREHLRARIWAAGALAILAANMLALLVMTPPKTDLMPPPLRAGRITTFETDAGACRAALRSAGFSIEPARDQREVGGCGYQDAVALTQSVHAYSGPVTTSCATAAALALWERDVVAPAAARYLGQPVARIELAGPVYACRRIAGRRDGRLSEHASANAVDIGGFTLDDGTVLTVARGWRGTARERAFLHAVRDGACAHFDAVLSPDYNRAHRDHLHFDLGPDELCR
jgi:hypothetical protein